MSVVKYGLYEADLESVREKISNQIEYLKSMSFKGQYSGKTKSFYEVSMSPNISERYYAMVLNKVSTYVSYNFSQNLTPVFLTVTLDGFFRDLVKGSFTRYNKVKDFYKQHIPNNKRFGYILDMLEEGHKLDNKNLYKILLFQWFRFLRSYTLQKLRQEGFKYNFIRVTEPHKDGIPHFHILFYLPKQFIPNLFKEFKKFFPAPRNHKRISMRENKRLASKINDKYFETQGFQTRIKSPTGYILKYILKTFINLKKSFKVDYLQAWYIHNKIPRIIMSKTLIPQDIYQKTRLIEQDWLYLTEIRDTGGYSKFIIKNITLYRSKSSDEERTIIFSTSFWKFLDKDGRTIIYDRGYLELSFNGKVLQTIGKKPSPLFFKPKENDKIDYISNPFPSQTPIAITEYSLSDNDITYSEEVYFPSYNDKDMIEVSFEDTSEIISDYFWFKGDSYSVLLPKDANELLEFYYKFDFTSVPAKIYSYCINLLIKLGLGEIIGYNRYILIL